MNQIVGNFEKVLQGMDLKVPAQMTELMQANVDRAIAAFEKTTETIKSYGEAANTALENQQALTRELGARIFDNTHANLSAVLGLAKKLAGARSIQEAISIQTDFVQSHTKRISAQANEMMSLASKTGAGTAAFWSSVLPKTTKV